MPWFEYTENNSGGVRWLSGEDHLNLIRSGWIVYNGAYTCEAYKQFSNENEAIAEWQAITGQSIDEEGCSCCGRPHYVNQSDGEPDWEYLNGPGRRYKTRVYDIVDTTGSPVERKALPEHA